MKIEQIYTTQKVADLLESNPRTIQGLCREGQLNAYKKLNKWFILHSDLIEYIKKSL